MELEYLSSSDNWEPAPNPHWNEIALYREKPKEKKKVSKWLWVLHGCGNITFVGLYYFATKEEASKFYPSEVICKIEGSKIEVEE
jgi:hypothetical protein